MFTIFINNYPIYLTNDLKHKSERHFHNFEDVQVLAVVKQLEEEKIDYVYLYHKNLNKLWKAFKKEFKVINAAGGKVYNSKKEVLFIYRFDIWDLPKGKIEKNETIEKSALREVLEETGVDNLELVKPLDTTYHIYQGKKKKIIKVTYWFEMKTLFNRELIPQIEEGITKVVWLDKNGIENALTNTYANIKLLFDYNY